MRTEDARLYRSFQIVNDWLRFAEAKNIALLTLNGAGIVGMHSLWGAHAPADASYLNRLLEGWLWWATICCLLSMLIGLASLIAKTKVPERAYFEALSAKSSGGIFFGHLADMREEEVLRSLVPGWQQSDARSYLYDMAGQIVTNAKITRKKFALFNVAVLLTVLGLANPLGAAIYYLWFWDEKL